MNVALFGNMIFAGVVKLQGDQTGFRVTSNTWCPYKKNHHGNTGVMLPQAKKRRLEQVLPSRFQGERGPVDVLILAFLTLALRGGEFL